VKEAKIAAHLFNIKIVFSPKNEKEEENIAHYKTRNSTTMKISILASALLPMNYCL
jgi:hypothetical protein